MEEGEVHVKLGVLSDEHSSAMDSDFFMDLMETPKEELVDCLDGEDGALNSSDVTINKEAVETESQDAEVVKDKRQLRLENKQQKEAELERERQVAFEKLQNLLQCTKKYSNYLSSELARYNNTFSEGTALGKSTTRDSETEKVENSPKSNENRQPKLFTGGQMRLYQLDGFEWLKLMFENGISCILADEMGLGKTIQSIAFIAQLIENGIRGPFLVCAPLSTVPNWLSEFKKFAPQIPVLLLHGDANTRKDLLKNISVVHSFGSYSSFPVVITTYEMPMMETTGLKRHKWRSLIIDEGHRIKNVKSMLRNTLMHYYHVEHKILLTGTPLQNNLTELWSLLNFIVPQIFNDLKVFESWFNISTIAEKGGDEAIIAQEQECHIVVSMHEILSTFLLRRTKTEVEINLPLKKEILVYAPMSAKQKQFYQSTFDKTITKLIGAQNRVEEEPKVEVLEYMASGRIKRKCNYEVKPEKTKTSEISLSLQNLIMHFRKICNHPYLVENPLDSETGYHQINEKIVHECGKLQVLDFLLQGLKRNGHKVLIFSFMVRMLQILQDYCELRGWSYCRLDGTMSLSDRCEQIAEFNSNEDVFIFLISTRAGGLGINLTAADTVVLYDTDWNPQVDLQAQDRCHRIGQTKPVVVYRLVTVSSIEERMVARATAKRKLEKIIIKNGRFSQTNGNKKFQDLSIDELKELLMATDQERKTVRSNGAIFTEQELNALLDRSDLTNQSNGCPKQIQEVNGLYKVISLDNVKLEL